MVKYYHCKKCKRVYNTETWIGEVHSYDGLCSSCNEEEQQEIQMQQESVEDQIMNTVDTQQTESEKNNLESVKSSPIELERTLLSNLEQKANDVLNGVGSIDVLIKDIKDNLIDKAKERIKQTIESFDTSKIDAEKVINYAEKRFDYLSEYKDFIDNVVIKLQNKPKMNVKTAIDKVFKETMGNMPKDVPKDVLLNKKASLKTVFRKVIKWHNFYSDTEDVYELTKKMFLHPFMEIQKKFSTLPFYSSN